MPSIVPQDYTYYLILMTFVIFLDLFSTITMSYILYCNHFRCKPTLFSPMERERSLSATMTIFVVYHAISSAINFVCGVLYDLDYGCGIGVATAGVRPYAIIFEFLRNLYMFLPHVVVSFVTFDRLLVLLLNMDYNEMRRRIVVCSDIICLALMALIVAHYQYYSYLDGFLVSIGVSFFHGKNWQFRFLVLIILKATIGGLNAFNCFAFMYQLRKLPTLKVRTRIVKITALIELFLGVIPSFVGVYYFLAIGSNGFQTLMFLVALDSAVNAAAYFVLLEKPKKWKRNETEPSSNMLGRESTGQLGEDNWPTQGGQLANSGEDNWPTQGNHPMETTPLKVVAGPWNQPVESCGEDFLGGGGISTAAQYGQS
ncbi:hypothetical protein Ddc_18109 [Ditylenchus destructor]|nr:hypothetical protein Ddc_18109 [Ditylenchus destructor]